MSNIPARIPIAREEDDRTSWLGRAADGRQFIGFAERAIQDRDAPADAVMHRWYAALHLFDESGAYLESKIAFTSEWTQWRKLPRDGVNAAQALLQDWLASLEPIKFGDIAISLFSTEKEGVKIALEASSNEDGSPRVDLWPNDLYFFPPWDGSYDT